MDLPEAASDKHAAKKKRRKALLPSLRLSLSVLRITPSNFILSFDGDIFLIFHCRLYFLFRNHHGQGSVFKLCLDVGFRYLVAYIETSAAGPAVTFSADVSAIVILLVSAVVGRSADGQISVLQFCLYSSFLTPGRFMVIS